MMDMIHLLHENSELRYENFMVKRENERLTLLFENAVGDWKDLKNRLEELTGEDLPLRLTYNPPLPPSISK